MKPVLMRKRSDLGLTASDATIATQIRADPTFRGNLGTFDRIQYEQMLRVRGFTEEAYVASMRREIARQQALQALRRQYKYRNLSRTRSISGVKKREALQSHM